MKIFAMLVAVITAGLLSFITGPLLSKRFSKYGLFFLNCTLGLIGTVFMITFFDINETEAEELVPWTVLLLAIVVSTTRALPGGEEKLRIWYDEPSDEDDKEYFSKKDMHGKPWWKFMFIPGWIILIFFNLFFLLGLVVYIFGNDWQFLFAGFFGSVVMSPIVIWNAIKRKRDYDNDYK